MFKNVCIKISIVWEPINEFLDRQRVNNFARFDELPAHRLCKIVFMELKNSECVEWKYVNYMKNIFQSIDPLLL
jgi:hypothetical protein